MKIKVYTREAEEFYPNGLAFAVHLALVDEEEKPLHNNYGILFPKGQVNEENVIVPSFTRDIRLYEVTEQMRENGPRYVISGRDVTGDGNLIQENAGRFWTWTTNDFLTFREYGLIDGQELAQLCGISNTENAPKDSVEISEEMAASIREYWNPLTFDCAEESPTEPHTLTVTYSDGSTHKKNLATYPKAHFPFAKGFGDPVFLLWEDSYYFIATNDNVGDIGLYVRKADTLDDLFAEGAQMHLILDKDEARGLIQTFWAPEFHVIGGELCILFAVSNENWGPQCHLMKLKEGGDILNPADWTDPVKIRRAGGKPLGEHGITLDMTYVKSGERHYYAWSYRENIGTPLDSGSMIMLAEFDPVNPTELLSEPICLSRPLYGFENTKGTINNEGPYAWYYDGTIYLAYSGGDARGYLYTVGMLTARDGEDLTDVNAWTKAKTPALSFASVPGELGPGHNSFFQDKEGDWWIAFHAVPEFSERIISDGIRRIHIDRTGRPRFDLAWEEDLPEKYRF